MHRLVIGGLAAACAMVMAEARAVGAIVTVTGVVDVVAPPPDSSDGAYTFPPGTPRFRVWQEQTDYVLPTGVDVDAAAVGIYNDFLDLSTTTLASGMHVASYFVHLDSPGGVGATAAGSITFDAPIIGVVVVGDGVGTSMHLDLSDILGASGTIYADALDSRGMELSANEYVRIFPGSLTIDFLCNISVPGDSFRVITAIPAPGPLGVGVAWIALGMRRRRR